MLLRKYFENITFSNDNDMSTVFGKSVDYFCCFSFCTFKNLSDCFLTEDMVEFSSFRECTFIIETEEDAKAFIDKCLLCASYFWPKSTVLDPNGHLSKLVEMKCPETGSFYGYKKVYHDATVLDIYEHPAVAVLLIPEDAKRSSAFGRKCRCSKAKVVDIYDVETGDQVKQAFSGYDCNFTYTVGETVSVDNFDEDRWHECAPGIHFFMTEKEAKEYQR